MSHCKDRKNMQVYMQPRRRQIYKPLTKICPSAAVDGWGRSTYKYDSINMINEFRVSYDIISAESNSKQN